MCLHFDSNYKAITQAVNFFSIKNGGSLNKLKALKLLFFADRYHLRKYGRPVSGDTYFAMPYGPVGTLAKDIAENSTYLNNNEKQYCEGYLAPSADSYSILSKAKLDLDPLSDSDIEALKFSWDNFHLFNPFQLAEITHAYPEWRKFQENLLGANVGREEMNYEDFFEDPDENDSNLGIMGNQDPFVSPISAEQKGCAFELAKEYSGIRAEWRK